MYMYVYCQKIWNSRGLTIDIILAKYKNMNICGALFIVFLQAILLDKLASFLSAKLIGVFRSYSVVFTSQKYEHLSYYKTPKA